jgi:hypothetical protein
MSDYTIFYNLRGRQSTVGHIEGQLFMNMMIMIDSSLPPVTQMWVTLSDIFLHISPEKKNTRKAFSRKGLK